MKTKIMGVRVSAIIEVLLFLTAVCVIDYFWGGGNRYITVSPHPFWLILLLVIVQYTINESLMCVLFMCLFLYIGNLPEQAVTQTSYEYWFELSKLPIMWMAAAIGLGGLNSRLRTRLNEAEENAQLARRQAKKITQSYLHLKDQNEQLELRLAEELGSAIKIYEAARTLENLDSTSHIDSANDIVASIINPEKFSIFTLEEEGLKMRSSYAWGDNDKYAKSFAKTSMIYHSIVDRKQVLCVINERDCEILGKEGVLAGPLINSETGQVFGMLKLEKVPFQAMSLKKIKMFSILCEWIGLAFKNLVRLESAESESILNHELRIFSQTMLQHQTDFLAALSRRMNFDFTKINIKLANPGEISPDEKKDVGILMGNAIRSALRKVDLVFDENKDEDKYAVLLAGTGEENAGIVIDKIRNALENSKGTVAKAKYSFSTQVIHKASLKEPEGDK